MVRILTLALGLVLAACASVPSNDGAILGPVVEGKLNGSADVGYIPFSAYTTGNPVITTEAWTSSKFLALTGGTLTGNFNVTGGYINAQGGPLYAQYNKTDFPTMWVRRSSGANQTAEVQLGLPSEYIRVGGGEWKANSYRMIGFGYGGTSSNAPASIGYQETNTSSNTYGDLLFATRPSNTNVAPTERLRITSAGDIKAPTAYAPANPTSLATKAYVDSVAVAGGAAPYLAVAPTTGQTYVIPVGTRFVRINPAADLAALTITLPATPTDGMEVQIVMNKKISALTVNAATGDTVLAQFTMPVATNVNDFCKFKYFATAKTWFQVG